MFSLILTSANVNCYFYAKNGYQNSKTHVYNQ